MMMMLAQQLSGINAAIFYSTSIFSSAGLSESDAQSATLGMGAMNVAMTFVSLVLIEKAGRKTLMLVGLSVMVVCTTMLLICLALAVSFANQSSVLELTCIPLYVHIGSSDFNRFLPKNDAITLLIKVCLFKNLNVP